MYSIGEIKKQNNQTERDEANRKVASYETQDNGDVWAKYDGRVRIYEKGTEADEFLAAVKGFRPGQLRAFLKKVYAPAIA